MQKIMNSCLIYLYFLFLWMVVLLFSNLLVGCGGSEEEEGDDDDKSISFVPVTVPSDDVQKRLVRASAGVTIDGTTYSLGYDNSGAGQNASGYEVILRSGENSGEIFGLIVDQDGSSVMQDGELYISNAADFTALMDADEKLYGITQFESLPGAMYLTQLERNGKTGRLAALSTATINVQSAGGLWMPSGGSVTPWETLLGGEINEPDARAFENAQSSDDVDVGIKSMLRYFGIADPFSSGVTLELIRERFRPYLYGYPVEAALDGNGQAAVNKRYAMGRLSVAMVYVMPDRKTVYIADGGSNGGLFVFVADTKEDLSAGNLYAAKWEQEDDLDGGMAKISWVDLGHATEEEVRLSMDQGIRFVDIFNAGRRNPDGTCSEAYVSINTQENGHECLALRTGMELAASRLETRRYAAMLGATTEFQGAEGLAYDSQAEILYLSINQISNGMEDNMSGDRSNDAYDRGGANHIRLPYNSCGCVYALELDDSRSLDSDYVARNISSVLCGTEDGDDNKTEGNRCDVDNIANPDNLTFISGYNTLVIAENSEGGHENNALWTYQIKTGELVRIQTSPYGGENTSTYLYPDIGGHAYLMSVVKHPYDGIYRNLLTDPADARCYVGFIGAMPAFE